MCDKKISENLRNLYEINMLGNFVFSIIIV